jgi:hypothetical protein
LLGSLLELVAIEEFGELSRSDSACGVILVVARIASAYHISASFVGWCSGEESEDWRQYKTNTWWPDLQTGAACVEIGLSSVVNLVFVGSPSKDVAQD